MAHCNLRTLLVLTLAILIVVSGSLSVTPPPRVQACNTCNFLLTWGSFGSANGQFMYPQGVAADSSGNVYVADNGNNRVEKFTSTGTFITKWGSTGASRSQFDVPRGVAADSSGNVYVADYGNNRVEKFTSTGTYITAWGCATAGTTGCPGSTTPGEFYHPVGVAVDSSGNVYVADGVNNRVEKFTSTGIYVTKWGTTGSLNGEFNSPYGVAADSSGNVYVTDFSNSRVQKFTATGIFTLTWGHLGTQNGNFTEPTGVAVDSSGNVYVADYVNNRVEKFTGAGAYITQWGSGGSGNGQFIHPQGVAVDSSGNVYVVDGANTRVELFSDPSTSASISLVNGWNLISLPLVPSNTAISNLLAGLILAHNFTIVWSYQGGAWKSFTPPSTGTLTTIANGFGYWIYVTHPSTLFVLGYVIAPPPSTPPSYSLSAGWNLVGFKPQPTVQSESVGQFLSSINGEYDQNSVWIYDNPSGSWIRADQTYLLKPGQAMWVLMTTQATLIP